VKIAGEMLPRCWRGNASAAADFRSCRRASAAKTVRAQAVSTRATRRPIDPPVVKLIDKIHPWVAGVYLRPLACRPHCNAQQARRSLYC
jgi:hypothetical protein